MRSYKTIPPLYTLVETQDGSSTLFSEKFQEACHSPAGAKTETIVHYIEGCRIQEKLNSDSPLCLLEVGLGAGVGFLESWELLQHSKTSWSYLSLEIDPLLLDWFKAEYSDHPFLKNLVWKSSQELRWLECSNSLGTLTILCGDARVTLPKYLELHPQKWNAIYQDAFSPRRNPLLWTVEWFELLKKFSAPDVIMSTYSASTSIRKSMIKVGWSVHKGEKFGTKRASTRATLQGETDPDIIDDLARSPISALSDDNIHKFRQD